MCKCLSCLNDESLRNSVALWTVWSAWLEKEMQQMLLMEKIQATKLALGDNMRQNNQNAPLYFIPFLTELPEVAEVLCNVKVCKHAIMAMLLMGKDAWVSCKQAVESGTSPQHGLKGQECARSKTFFKNLVEPGLMEFYATVVLPLSGPHPTCLTCQQVGATVEDFEGTSELDLEGTKRQLFGRYCFDLRYTVMKGSSSMEVER
jgi:hypothetical protein